jgi:hypothetical protein
VYLPAKWQAVIPPIDLPKTPILPSSFNNYNEAARALSASHCAYEGEENSNAPIVDSPYPL